MEFDPHNPIVKKCLIGIAHKDAERIELATRVFEDAWNESSNDFERFLTAFFVATVQQQAQQQCDWYGRSLQYALSDGSVAAQSALARLHTELARVYRVLERPTDAQEHHDQASAARSLFNDSGPFYHGTKAQLKIGDHLVAGMKSNYQAELTMNHVYFSASANGAGLAAALSTLEGPERVYLVQPTGEVEADPNVSDKKFPGNLTRSYRSAKPLLIVGEVHNWKAISAEQRSEWNEKLKGNKGEIIN